MGPDNTVLIKVGMQGRVILGPEGGGPARSMCRCGMPSFAKRVDTQGRSRPSWTASRWRCRPNEGNVLFSHVTEGLDFPMPRGGEIDNYVVYIGFDPAGAEPEPKKPAPKPGKPAKPKPPAGQAAASQSRIGIYQPRSATTVLLSARMSAITARAPALVRCAPRLGLVWLPPIKPIGTMPAAWAAETPAGESSTTMHSAGLTRILAATCRNRSGAGLPRGTSLAENR